ncbi:MAG: hypothetical protein IT454_04340 [Planctomycetes bacterium]|nr:hypothetical protein [Planctomycetota bacterium]
MATTSAPLTNCPTCGVKLHRTDLSLCAYCAAPLRMGASTAAPDDETQRLFAKIQNHPSFAAAMTWTPLEPEVDAKATRLAAWGWMFVALAVAFCVGAAFMDKGGYIGRWPVLVAVLWIAISIFLLAGAVTVRGNAKHATILRRPARVLDRRSRTELSEKLGATTYYFQLRCSDGSEGEFRFTGRGTLYEPPTVGASGIAYTRGDTLIEFKRF